MAREYIFSASDIYAAIRAQPCFDENSNMEVRAVIRAEMRCGREYWVDRTAKNKRKLQGEMHGYKWHLRENNPYVRVVRVKDDAFKMVGFNLKFQCPMCGSREMSRHNVLSYYSSDRTIICETCWRAEFRNIDGQIRTLTKLTKLLAKGEWNEEYIRFAQCSDSGFGGPAFGEYQPSGSARPRLSGEKHRRYLEGGSGGFSDALGSFPAGLAATTAAASRRWEMMSWLWEARQ